MIDFPKESNHILFVSDPSEIKESRRFLQNEDEDEEIPAEIDEPQTVFKGEKERYASELKRNLAENKG